MKYYRLEKIAIDEGKHSSVSVGTSVEAESLTTGGPTNRNSDSGLDDIIEGTQLLIVESAFRFIRTSPITEILERVDGFVKFKTTSSVYLLEEKHEEK